jgi:uncharacterized protein (TIGR00725 family)
MRVSIIGGSTVPDSVADTAAATGRLLAQRGHTVVCGGLGGVMEAACRGARAAGGHTIGILPGERLEDANEYVETPIATGLGHARNSLVVVNGDAAIAISGSGGTLSEIGYARVFERPLVGLGTLDVPGLDQFETPEAAVEAVEERVEREA